MRSLRREFCLCRPQVPGGGAPGYEGPPVPTRSGQGQELPVPTPPPGKSLPGVEGGPGQSAEVTVPPRRERGVKAPEALEEVRPSALGTDEEGAMEMEDVMSDGCWWLELVLHLPRRVVVHPM